MKNGTKCQKNILITGGTGYIGSHTCIEVLKEGYSVVVVDNFINSSKECLTAVEKLTGQNITFYDVDLLNKDAIQKVFQKHDIFAVLHFAGLKAVGESCAQPVRYYTNNVSGLLNLVQVMQEFKVTNIIFSSSATVYGTPKKLPIDETHPVGNCTNPYGKTKYFIEEILSDITKTDKEWNVVLLRYFNPIGSHKSGEIGEDPDGLPNNLMPFVAQVAGGKLSCLKVFGDDYDTPDGTGVRDYIHVVDLAIGHVCALKCLHENSGLKVYNLGTGNGYSVMEMIKAFEKASGRTINYEIVGRREGDIAACYADASLAEQELGWKATRGIDEMCEDLWRWQVSHPNGFSTK